MEGLTRSFLTSRNLSKSGLGFKKVLNPGGWTLEQADLIFLGFAEWRLNLLRFYFGFSGSAEGLKFGPRLNVS